MIPIHRLVRPRKRRKLMIVIASFLFVLATLFMLVDEWLYYDQAATHPSSLSIQIPVLSYHSIQAQSKDKYVVSPEQFEQQMSWLHEEGYTSINLAQFDLLMRGKAKLTGREVLITFDDGYEDNYTEAYPILNKYGFKAALFVITSWVGGGSYLHWDQIRQLHQAGWDIMSHTRTHPYLPIHSARNQREEIKGSREVLEAQLASKVDVIAYPYGFRSSETVKLASESGYAYGFTFDEGMATSAQNPLLLKRLFISGKDDLNTFQSKLRKAS